MNGKFIISLDFELHWGAPEKGDLNHKSEYFLNTRKIIDEMLFLFEKYEIKVTWATVGFLFASTIEESKKFHPNPTPGYLDKQFNYYHLFENNSVGANEIEDPFHFGASLIKKILRTSGQELASHTFSHFYCTELGQNGLEFDADLNAAQSISEALFQTKLISLVFPRNQYNVDYIDIISRNNFKVIRTNPNVWFWNKTYKFNFLVRAYDTLMPISKSRTFKNSEIKTYKGVVLLPASRFFRPFSSKEKIIQSLKLSRIKGEMTYAAKHGENYHLWWHPHNFGYHIKENMEQLHVLLKHYNFLKEKYHFESVSMKDYYHEK